MQVGRNPVEYYMEGNHRNFKKVTIEGWVVAREVKRRRSSSPNNESRTLQVSNNSGNLQVERELGGRG
jgi:hypothetical protein